MPKAGRQLAIVGIGVVAALGVVVVRLRQPSRVKIHQRVLAALNAFDESEWPGLLVTMRDTAMSTWRISRG